MVGVIGTTYGLFWALDERDRADAAATAERLAKAEAEQRADELLEVVRFQERQFADLDPAGMGVALREGLGRDWLRWARGAAWTKQPPRTLSRTSMRWSPALTSPGWPCSCSSEAYSNQP